MKKEKGQGKPIPASALLVILGLVLIIFRNAAPEIVLRILAVGLLVVGAAGIFQQVRTRRRKKQAASEKDLCMRSISFWELPSW